MYSPDDGSMIMIYSVPIIIFNFWFCFRPRPLVRRHGVREIGQTPERIAELSRHKLLHKYARAEFVDVARTHYVLLSDRQRNGLLVV